MSTLSYTKFSQPSSPIQISNFSIIYNLFDEVNDKLNSNLLGAKVNMNEIKSMLKLTKNIFYFSIANTEHLMNVL